MSESRFKVRADSVAIDDALAPELGWRDLQVRWLVGAESMGSEDTVVGYSVFPPGAAHELHRHPRAEEWEYVLRGSGVKRVGDEEIEIAAGDLVFTPRDVYHGVFNDSAQTLETLWGYCGAASLDGAGYVLPGGEPSLRAWPGGSERAR